MVCPSHPVVLVVQNDALHADFVEDVLTEGRFNTVAVEPTSDGAKSFLQEHPADAVLLDFPLRDGSSIRAVGELARRGIPFAVLSAVSREECKLPAFFNRVDWVEKPATPAQVVQTVRRLVVRERS